MMEELIVIAPFQTSAFFVRVLTFGFIIGSLLIPPTTLFVFESILFPVAELDVCEKFYRAWLVVRILVFALQTPIRAWIYFLLIKFRMQRLNRIEMIDRLTELSQSHIWRWNHIMGLVLYILFGLLLFATYYFWDFWNSDGLSSVDILQFIFYHISSIFSPFEGEYKWPDPIQCKSASTFFFDISMVHVGLFLVHMMFSYYSLRKLIANLFPYEEARGVPVVIIDKTTTLSAFDAEKNSDKSCPICYEEYVDKAVLRVLICKHYFHDKCITGWLSQKKICPICLTDIETGNAGAKDHLE